MNKNGNGISGESLPDKVYVVVRGSSSFSAGDVLMSAHFDKKKAQEYLAEKLKKVPARSKSKYYIVPVPLDSGPYLSWMPKKLIEAGIVL